jgi:hypothetical protein
MMTFFAIYGFVAIVSFVTNFLVLNWGCFKDEIMILMSLQTAALMAIIWPVTMVYLFISITKGIINKFKRSK